MKRVFKWFKKQLAWVTSRQVLNAINNGSTYEEVCDIAKEEAKK